MLSVMATSNSISKALVDSAEDSVLQYLINDEHIDPHVAKAIYQDGNSLFHRIVAMDNNQEVDGRDIQVRRSLVLIIQERFSIDEQTSK